MNRRLQSALLAAYRAAATRGPLSRGPGRRAVEAAYLSYKRLFEAGSPKHLAAVVAEGSTVIDVGANIGYFTLPFARRVGPQGRVIALEPEAVNFHRLSVRLDKAGLAGRALLFEAAAAERSGRERLVINPAHPGDHKLADETAAHSVEIDAHALDELIDAHPGPPVSLIKIDVQGAELRVVMGARDLIARDRPALLVEIDPAIAGSAGDAAAELLAMLGDLGYAFHVWGRRGVGVRQPPEAILAAAKAAGYLDVFCVRV